MDKYKTMVVFRTWRDTGDVIALFPCRKENGYFLSYEHVGQHGGANWNCVIKQTRPATPEEAIDLADELKKIGYNLASRRKGPSYRFQKKWLEMGNA